MVHCGSKSRFVESIFQDCFIFPKSFCHSMMLFISQHFENFEKNAVLDFEESLKDVVHIRSHIETLRSHCSKCSTSSGKKELPASSSGRTLVNSL